MVRAIATGVLVAPGLVLGVACGGDDDDVVSNDTFTSDAHRYSIAYPEDWTITNPEGDSELFTGPDGQTTMLIEFGPGPDADVDAPTFEADMREAIVGHNSRATGIASLGVQDVSGEKALVFEYTQGEGENANYYRQAWVPNGDSSWYVTMSTPAASKDASLGTLDEMLSSFAPRK